MFKNKSILALSLVLGLIISGLFGVSIATSQVVIPEGAALPAAPPDTIAPIITLSGSATVNLTVSDSYIDAGATAWDDVDGDITGNIIIVNPVNTAVAGTYIVTYNVFDGAGNPAVEVNRTVIVSAVPVPPVLPPPSSGGGGGSSGGGSGIVPPPPPSGQVLGAFTINPQIFEELLRVLRLHRGQVLGAFTSPIIKILEDLAGLLRSVQH